MLNTEELLPSKSENKYTYTTMDLTDNYEAKIEKNKVISDCDKYHKENEAEYIEESGDS